VGAYIEARPANVLAVNFYILLKIFSNILIRLTINNCIKY